MAVNASKLAFELAAVGVAAELDDNGELIFPTETPTYYQMLAREVLAKHDPTETPEQVIIRLGLEPRIAALFLVVTQGMNAPTWAQKSVEDIANQIIAIDEAAWSSPVVTSMANKLD